MSSRRNFTKTVALAATLGVSSIAGCAGDTDSASDSGGSSGSETEQISYDGPIPTEIIENAQGDGGATVYGATGSSQVVEMIDGMKEAVSFAEGDYVQLGDSGIASRLTSELRSDNVTADALFSTGMGATITLSEETDTLRQTPDYLREMFDDLGYPEEAYGDYFTPANVFPIVTYYNTNRMSEEELPDSYLGMTEDRFDGEIVMETPAVPGGNDAFFATLEEEWGTAQFEEWVQGLFDNNLQETDSGGRLIPRSQTATT